MIHEKIKFIRLYYDLKENQVASILNMNSYKYKRCERDDKFVSVDLLILFSIVYGVPLTYFLSCEIMPSDFNKYIPLLTQPFDNSDVILCLKKNICGYFNPPKKRANYETIILLLNDIYKKLGCKIKDRRNELGVEINEILKELEISYETYLLMEYGTFRFTIYQFQCILDMLDIDIEVIV